MIWDMRGALDKSKFPPKNANSVTHYGTAKINGVEYEIKGWLKPPRKPGEEPWISMLFERKEEEEEEEDPEPFESPSRQVIGENDIPF